MIRSILLGVVFALSLRHSVSVQFPIMDVPELIEYWGYEVETHTVVTIDLYILNMHRIPSKNPNATAVFLQHGLFGSSARFVTGPPNKVTIDPLGRPTVTVDSDHYFYTCCPSVRTNASVPAFQNLTNQNHFQVKITITIGMTVCLA